MDPSHPNVVDPLDELVRRLDGVATVADAARCVVEVAVSVVPGCDHGAITVLDRRRPATLAVDGPTAEAVSELQDASLAGPAVDALMAQPEVVVEDLVQDERWPALADELRDETPVRAALAVRMVHAGRTIGSLGLYAERPGALGADALEVARLLAAHAAPALGRIAEAEQLRTGLAGRDLIATAKGVLMARQGISEDEAFDVLRRASRRTNVKVRELARSIVAPAEASVEPIDATQVSAVGASFDRLHGADDPTLVIVTVQDRAGRRGGCLVSRHSRAGTDPASTALWIERGGHTEEVLRDATHLAVHHLAAGDEPLADDFGSSSGHDGDELDRHATSAGPFGVPFLQVCRTRVAARVVARHDDAGDHLCVVVEPLVVELVEPFVPLRASALARWSVVRAGGVEGVRR